MTDKDIINALECCKSDFGKCNDCFYCKSPNSCFPELADDALCLIKRQQAEIERLNKEIQITKDSYTMLQTKCEIVKSEAVKEFAERVKESFFNLEYKANTNRKTVKLEELKEQMEWVLHTVAIGTIDNLVKEMVGENNE